DAARHRATVDRIAQPALVVLDRSIPARRSALRSLRHRRNPPRSERARRQRTPVGQRAAMRSVSASEADRIVLARALLTGKDEPGVRASLERAQPLPPTPGPA